MKLGRQLLIAPLVTATVALAAGGAYAFLDWRDSHRPSIRSVSVYVRTETMRRLLHISPRHPLSYRGVEVKCLGSAPWRKKNPGVPA